MQLGVQKVEWRCSVEFHLRECAGPIARAYIRRYESSPRSESHFEDAKDPWLLLCLGPAAGVVWKPSESWGDSCA